MVQILGVLAKDGKRYWLWGLVPNIRTHKKDITCLLIFESLWGETGAHLGVIQSHGFGLGNSIGQGDNVRASFHQDAFYHG